MKYKHTTLDGTVHVFETKDEFFNYLNSCDMGRFEKIWEKKKDVFDFAKTK